MSYLKDRLSPSLFVESVPVEGEKKTFTPDLKGLIAWLETQDGATTYEYWDGHDCLLCRFGKLLTGHIGIAENGIFHLDAVSFATPWTYSAALSRARAELSRS